MCPTERDGLWASVRLLGEFDEERYPVVRAHNAKSMAFARQVFGQIDSSGLHRNLLAACHVDFCQARDRNHVAARVRVVPALKEAGS